MLINNIKITLWLKLEKASLEQKRGKNVSYSIVHLKSSNATSIKSNVTRIKTVRCINHFLLFHRRQNGRACIKIRRKNLKAYAGKGGAGGLPLPRLQNSPYFCVFKYARAVKQKVSNKAENRERGSSDFISPELLLFLNCSFTTCHHQLRNSQKFINFMNSWKPTN